MNFLTADSIKENTGLYYATGEEAENIAGRIITSFIPILLDASYKIMLYSDGNYIEVNTTNICFYNENGEFVDSMHNLTQVNRLILITSIPENSKYMRCDFYLDDGEHALSYFTKQMILDKKPTITFFLSNLDNLLNPQELLEPVAAVSLTTQTNEKGLLITAQTTEGFTKANIENFGYTNVNLLIEF